MDSNVDKREFGFLFYIIIAYLGVIGINVGIKSYNCSCVASLISTFTMMGLGFGVTMLYALALKPKINQLILFILSIALALAAPVFYVYDLAYKNLIGFLSVPFILLLCGMWIFTRFAREEV